MVFGHNTNLKLGNLTYHVQTEDRGESHALIDTTVNYRGRVLHRRTNNYFDLLPLNNDRQQALKLRVDEQHRTVIEEIRSGKLIVAVPPPTEKLPAPQAQAVAPPVEPQVGRAPRKLVLELLNAKTWLNGRQATLQLAVRESDGVPVPGALVKVDIEGSANENAYFGQTGSLGQVEIAFEMPRITSHDPALVVLAEDQGVQGLLRFSLRAKPRVPSV
jgi:hypothetical protein